MRSAPHDIRSSLSDMLSLGVWDRTQGPHGFELITKRLSLQ